LGEFLHGMAPSLPAIRGRKDPRPLPGRRLQGVHSLPVLPPPQVRTVYLYEHVHEHYHFLYPQPQLHEPAAVPEIAVQPAPTPKLDTMPVPVQLNPPLSRPNSGRSVVVEEEEEVAEAPLPQAPQMSLLQVSPDRTMVESRGSAVSIQLSSAPGSEEDDKARLSQLPPRRPRRKGQAEPEDKLSQRLRVLEAESRWTRHRRDLRRYIRDLPDTSKSKAKQKLVGQRVTGTQEDKTRLESQKARETQESRDVVSHIESEIHACGRSRRKVVRLQQALRRRLGMLSLELMGQASAEEGDAREEHGEENEDFSSSLGLGATGY